MIRLAIRTLALVVSIGTPAAASLGSTGAYQTDKPEVTCELALAQIQFEAHHLRQSGYALWAGSYLRAGVGGEEAVFWCEDGGLRYEN